MNLSGNSKFFKYNPTMKQDSGDSYDFYYVTYPVDIDEYRLKMFRSDVYGYFDVQRIMNRGEYEYNIVQSPAAANQVMRNTLNFSVIDVYGFNDVLGNRYAQVLPDRISRIIRRSMNGRTAKRDRRTGTIINTYFDKNRVSKDDLVY